MTPGENVFWSAESESGGGRDYEDIMLRRVPAAVVHRFRGALWARGFTHAQYLTALVSLHEAMRKLTEIKTTIPADNMPPPSSFQPPVQVSVTGVDLGHPGLGPLATARLVSSPGLRAGPVHPDGPRPGAGQARRPG